MQTKIAKNVNNSAEAPQDQSKPPLLMVQTILFASTFLIAAIGVPWYAIAVGFEWTAWVAFVLFVGMTGISITAG